MSTRYRTDYETIAAGQTDQVMGATGAAGDRLCTLVIVPTTTGAGTVQIQDGAGSEITVFTGGGTLSDLKTHTIDFGPDGIRSVSGAWKITTGANVSVIAVGAFT